jgi:hypothetical protein
MIVNPGRAFIRHTRRSLTRRFLRWPTRIPYGAILRTALPETLRESELPCVVPNWDNTPRSGRKGVVVTGSSPEAFSRHLDQAICAVEARPFGDRLVFLKSWNEWAEGNFVEPDQQYGRGYLEAIQRVQYASEHVRRHRLFAASVVVKPKSIHARAGMTVRPDSLPPGLP